MRISFCFICYNEEHLIGQQLANLYKHAHEIIIVEGRTIELGDKFPKTRDNTLSIIEQFPDPQNKITLVSKDCWPTKNHMVGAYYEKATGDYVWHIDCDEFYSPQCIENTRNYIQETKKSNYAHDEYYYYRYYNVVVAKEGNKFWNKPARIHAKLRGRKLSHRPQLLVGSHEKRDVELIPRQIGIRHHYSIVSLAKVRMKANFYGTDKHSRYFDTYTKPIAELIREKVCVRPDNDGKQNSIPAVLEPGELEIPDGVDSLFEYYEHPDFPWTTRARAKIYIVIDDNHTDVRVINSSELAQLEPELNDLVVVSTPVSKQVSVECNVLAMRRSEKIGMSGYGPYIQTPNRSKGDISPDAQGNGLVTK